MISGLGYKRPLEWCANAVEGMSQCPGFLYSSTADVEKQENGSPRRLNGHHLSHDQERGLKLGMPVMHCESNPGARRAGAM